MAQVDSENSTAMPVASTRRGFLSQAAVLTAGGAAIATALAVAGSAAGAGQAPDPVHAAIEAHRVAAAAYETADEAHSEVLWPVQKAAIALCRGDPRVASTWWHFAPNDLGFYCKWPDFQPHVDVSDLPVPPGTSKCYTPVWTHEDIDMIADLGIMYRGERERLHAALDENLRRKDAIDRLGVAADEALEAERRAMRGLIDTKPTTMAGAGALIGYLGAMVG